MFQKIDNEGSKFMKVRYNTLKYIEMHLGINDANVHYAIEHGIHKYRAKDVL